MLASIEGGSDFRADLYRMWLAELRGDVETARSLLPDPQRAGGSGDGLAQIHSARAGVLFRMGEHNAARAEIEVMLRSADGEHEDINHYLPACIDAVVALCDDATIAGILRDSVKRLPTGGAATDPPDLANPFIFSTLQGRPVHATRAALHLRRGDTAAARAHYAAGLAWAESRGCTTAAAQCRKGLSTAIE
jgi:hypothetical protein